MRHPKNEGPREVLKRLLSLTWEPQPMAIGRARAFPYHEARDYSDGSIADNLRCCESLKELNEWEARAQAAAHASSGTRKRWAGIASARRAALEVAA